MSNGQHFVYVVATVSEQGALVGPIKIGISRCPDQRVWYLQTSNPRPLRNAFQFPVSDKDMALWVEKRSHRVLADARMEGEWFNHHPARGIAVVTIAIEEFCLEQKPQLYANDWAQLAEDLYEYGCFHAQHMIQRTWPTLKLGWRTEKEEAKAPPQSS
jgi:hypothetical protein